MPLMPPRIAVLATLLAPLVALHAVDSAGPDLKLKPNMVVILADDLGYSDFGCYGGKIDPPNKVPRCFQRVKQTAFGRP